jgi:hypothetical protein
MSMSLPPPPAEEKSKKLSTTDSTEMSDRKEGPINILKSRAGLTRKAYGVARVELFQCLKVHKENDGGSPTLAEVKQSPELYDGAVGGMNATDELILRNEDAGCVMDDEPLDRLVAAFDDCVASWGARKPTE